MIELIKPEVSNFVRYCINAGATITDLVIPTPDPNWPGLCNPSIFVDGDELKLVLRNVNYVMHASTFENKNWSCWGPLEYIIPDSDREGRHLRTRNYLCKINESGSIADYSLVNTSKYDKKPKWEFVGHEDARLVRWDDKLYMTGVRRDDNTTGIGRMSLCAIDDKSNEISRKKIDGIECGYCEKNWTPIIDMPYHYVRFTHPTTEIVKVDPKTGKFETVIVKEQNIELNHDMMLRGSSQVIPWKNGKHITLVHTCNLFINENDKKYSRYHFHFVVWDAEWNIEAISPIFTFNDFNIEFSNGLALKDGKFYIPFALQDNMAFLLKVDEDVVEDFIYRTPSLNIPVGIAEDDYVTAMFLNDKDPHTLLNLAEHYYNIGFKAGAYCLYQRIIDYLEAPNVEWDILEKQEYINQLYNISFWMARSLADIGCRDEAELELWWKLIDIDPTRPEGWMALHRYYSWRSVVNEAYHFAKLAYDNKDNHQIYYNAYEYELGWINSMMYTSHREFAIQYAMEHPENKQLVDLVNNIIEHQQEIHRIL